MGKIAEEILAMLAAHIEKHGIVVWYDPERAYEKFVGTLTIPDTTFLFFEGSLFHLREKLEPFLEYIDEQGRPRNNCAMPPRLVLYILLERKSTSNALIEVECAGAVVEPGAHAWQHNSRLRSVAERVYKKIVPEGVRDICKNIDAGLYDFETLDSLSLDLTSLDLSLIKHIFGTSAPSDITLAFLSSIDRDEAIISKGALGELAPFFSKEFGFPLPQTGSPEVLRKSLQERLLTGDLLELSSHGKIKEIIVQLSLPEEKEYARRIKGLCAQWRNRLDCRESYIAAAKETEKKHHINELALSVEQCLPLETFPFFERFLITSAQRSIVEGEAEITLSLGKSRSSSFWTSQEPLFQLHWALIEHCARVLIAGTNVRGDLKKVKKNPSSMVKAYTEGDSPWCTLDRDYRALESLYSRFDIDPEGSQDTVEQIVISARQDYTKTTEYLVESFVHALTDAHFHIPEILPQHNIFSSIVAPFVKKKVKTAFILVDSLRFEMGRELIEGLMLEFDIELKPSLAQPPTITTIGFASLMPEAEKGIDLVEVSGTAAAPSLGNAILKDRASRIRYLKEHVKETLAVCKLNDILKLSKDCRKSINEAQLIVVTSQEIDILGEGNDDAADARIYMDEMLEKLRRVIRRLASLCVDIMIITADHGHLFGEALESGMKMAPPGGKTIELHRRVWIGKGGAQAPGYLRVAAHDIGLGGDLELAFPKSLSCFIAGGSTSYLHGGLSLQEMVIPCIILSRKIETAYTKAMAKITLSMDKMQVTTRFFSVTATYEGTDFFSPPELRIKASVCDRKKEIGIAAMAAYGYEAGTKEIVLEKDKPNVVTFMITDEKEVKSLSVHIHDSISMDEMARLEAIPVTLSI